MAFAVLPQDANPCPQCREKPEWCFNKDCPFADPPLPPPGRVWRFMERVGEWMFPLRKDGA